MKYLMSLILFTSTPSHAALVWQAVGSSDECIYGGSGIEPEPVGICKTEGELKDIITSGTQGNECNPVTITTFICCGEKISCDSLAEEDRPLESDR